MIDRILRLGKETAVYGLSTVVGRLLNFLLVPLYANLLTPSENGIIATLYAYVAFVAVVYGFGMEQAYMRFAADLPSQERSGIFRKAWLAALPAAALSLIVHLAGRSASVAIGFGIDGAALVTLAAWILAADAAAAIPFAALRLERKPMMFAILKLSNIVLTIVGTVYLVVGLGWGAEGVMAANLGASIITLGAVVVATRTAWAGTTTDPSPGWKELWRFGFPLMPAGLAGIALQVIDRPLVRALTDDATVGIYQLNYRLGIFMMLAVGMFDYAWRPFFLQHARDADAKALFSRVFTYLVTFMAAIFLSVSLFVDDLVRLPFGNSTFFPPAYWDGTAIVPVVLAAYACTGAYVVFLTGVYLEKRTGIVPVIAGLAAAVNVAANLVLVPKLGIMGAALATLIGHVVQTVWMFFASQKHLRIEFEWKRVGAAVVWTASMFAANFVLSPEPLKPGGLFVKCGFFGVFVVGLFVFRIVRVSEFAGLLSERTTGSSR
ncbi:MAG: hypothetical protein A3H45_11845 [Ignavibacteria bacterium RIFCSPLOWO2_02_FULL_55_14]|nr:MAG: hypothetical protein A3H45_11845 [Ignavibacteria bacterium RIFCSPLOWO2_02_FULL_55_14]OGU75897.1 MAG: hypothetical protein A3G43_08860 [Ignavibacteria bacterium RIFCSPLOWO2_12_FULL_56_21]